MSCRTQFCIGGGCEPTETDVSAWLAAFGYQYDPNDPLGQDYKNVIAEAPSATRSAVWDALAEACMRSRAMLFCNQTPGDSGTTQSAAASSNALGVSLSQNLSTEAQVGGLAANALQAVPVVGQIAGPALQEILSLFQHHAQAEAAQSGALSKLGPYVTQAIRQVDYAVASGQISPEEGVSFLESISASMKSSDASLTKSCNAFCGYNAIVDCIAKVSTYYYALLSPSASGDSILSGLSPSTAQANESGIVAGATLTSNPLLIILAIVAVVLLIPRMGGERRA